MYWRVAGQDSSFAFRIMLNGGFLFDAENDDNGEVPDASSYLFVGPSVKATFGQKSQLVLDLLFGQSEIMSDIELFSRSPSRKEMLRFRPRINFAIGEGSLAESGRIYVGMWADLGVDERVPDTFVIFIMKQFAQLGH